MTSRSPLRLGFVGDRKVHLGPDGAWLDPGVARILELLGERFSGLTIALSRAPAPSPKFNHRTHLDPACFLPLPEILTVQQGLPLFPRCLPIVRRIEACSDVVLVQLPFAPMPALLGAQRPRVYHVCADLAAGVKASPYYTGPRRALAVAVGDAFHGLSRFLVHRPHARVLTNGHGLLERLGHPPGRAMVSSTLLAREIQSVSRQRPAGGRFRVLYVGYLRHEKGTDTLIEAFELLRQRVPDAELHIVGTRDQAEHGIRAQLDAAVARMGAQDAVRFLGHKPFGPELFQCFADADALALASRMEGTPRVLVEARAFGCPVVATNVGGIPTSVTDAVDGLLVPPADPRALADALVRLATDRLLHARLVEGGLARARRTTVEALVDGLTEELLLAAGAPAP